MAISIPAMVATRVDRNNPLAMTIISTTARMPTTAVEIRQESEFSAPKARKPREISHLPSGGCTTNDPPVV